MNTTIPDTTLKAADFAAPTVLLAGTVDYDMYRDFRAQIGKAPCEGLVVVALTTLGGDPEVARMMGEDIHERKMNKELHVQGPLTTCIAAVKATLHEIECSIAIQNEGFANLVEGSSVTLDQVIERAPYNWYIEAEEARTLGLIEAVI